MGNCIQCGYELEERFAFCPHCGFAIQNGAASSPIEQCMQYRSGVTRFCFRCGFEAFDDDQDIRRRANLLWGSGAVVCAAISFLMFYLANPDRYTKEEKRSTLRGRESRLFGTIAIAGIVGVGACVFKMRFGRESES